MSNSVGRIYEHKTFGKVVAVERDGDMVNIVKRRAADGVFVLEKVSAAALGPPSTATGGDDDENTQALFRAASELLKTKQ
jgi:hypothetical protein